MTLANARAIGIVVVVVDAVILGFFVGVINSRRAGLAAGIPSFLMCLLIKNQVQQVAEDTKNEKRKAKQNKASHLQMHSNCLQLMGHGA